MVRELRISGKSETDSHSRILRLFDDFDQAIEARFGADGTDESVPVVSSDETGVEETNSKADREVAKDVERDILRKAIDVEANRAR